MSTLDAAYRLFGSEDKSAVSLAVSRTCYSSVSLGQCDSGVYEHRSLYIFTDTVIGVDAKNSSTKVRKVVHGKHDGKSFIILFFCHVCCLRGLGVAQ